MALGAAYAIWGGFPIFVRWMSAMQADEFLYVRISFSFMLLTSLYLVRGRLGSVMASICRLRFLMHCAVTGFCIAMNWLFYIIAVNKNLTSQASMGYFICPLISAGLGVYLFGEKLDSWKITALSFALAGVLYQSFILHSVPWLALAIGISFALYGALRKKMSLPPVQGMYTELLVMMPIVCGCWLYLAAQGKTFAYGEHPTMWLMCLAAGVITLAPLLFFLYAVQHISLTAVGFAQYSTPTLQFLLAVLYFKEPFDGHRLAAFILIWTGLAIVSFRLIQQTRSKP